MVDLENAQRIPGRCGPVSERVQARAQDDVLGDASRDGVRKLVFGDAAPNRKERSLMRGDPSPLPRMVVQVARFDDPSGERVDEDWGHVENLMRCATERDSISSSTRSIVHHGGGPGHARLHRDGAGGRSALEHRRDDADEIQGPGDEHESARTGERARSLERAGGPRF